MSNMTPRNEHPQHASENRSSASLFWCAALCALGIVVVIACLVPTALKQSEPKRASYMQIPIVSEIGWRIDDMIAQQNPPAVGNYTLDADKTVSLWENHKAYDDECNFHYGDAYCLVDGNGESMIIQVWDMETLDDGTETPYVSLVASDYRVDAENGFYAKAVLHCPAGYCETLFSYPLVSLDVSEDGAEVSYETAGGIIEHVTLKQPTGVQKSYRVVDDGEGIVEKVISIGDAGRITTEYVVHSKSN